MKCLSCSHSWKRSKLTEYVSLLARNDFILSIVKAIKNIFSKSK